MYDSLQFSSEWRRVKNHQVEGVSDSRVGVRCDHCQLVSQLSQQNFRVCLWNVGTIRGRSNEAV